MFLYCCHITVILPHSISSNTIHTFVDILINICSFWIVLPFFSLYSLHFVYFLNYCWYCTMTYVITIQYACDSSSKYYIQRNEKSNGLSCGFTQKQFIFSYMKGVSNITFNHIIS